MRDFRDEQLMSGTWGEIWVDDEYVASLKKFTAKVKMDYADVVRPKDLWDGKKLMKLSGEGEIVLGKISSFGIKLMHEKLSQGKTPTCKILGKLADPDALGAERIVMKNVTFNEMTLFDFEHAKDLEETVPFNFRHYEIYDLVD